MQNPISYSVVIPLKNEEENVRELIEELVPVLESMGKPWELICIDDGSTDATTQILQQIREDLPLLRIVKFDQNYGQSSAFDAGFRLAHGDLIITLDGDRQNDPRDIPNLIALIDNADLVCGARLGRKDNWVKRITSKIANAVRSRFCQDGIQDTGCSLKVYRREAIQRIKMYHGMHRFLPALFLIEGFRVKEVPVNHRERVKGKTKYNFFNRSFNTIADMLAVRWMRQRQLRYRIDKELP